MTGGRITIGALALGTAGGAYELALKYSVNFNQHNLYSFDVCGGCEALAIEYNYNEHFKKDKNIKVKDGKLLKHYTLEEYKSYPRLSRCPHPEGKYPSPEFFKHGIKENDIEMTSTNYTR